MYDGLKAATRARVAARDLRIAKMIKLLKEDPGLTRAELGERLGVGARTLSVYMRTSEDEGRLPDGTLRRFRAQGRVMRRRQRILTVDARRRGVLKALRRNPGLTTHQIADQFGTSMRTAQRDLGDLKRRGFIIRGRRGTRIASSYIAAAKELKTRELLGLLKAEPGISRKELSEKLDIVKTKVTEDLRTLKTRGDLPATFKLRRAPTADRLMARMDSKMARRRPAILRGIAQDRFNYLIARELHVSSSTITKDLFAMRFAGDPGLRDAERRRARLRTARRPPKRKTFADTARAIDAALRAAMGKGLDEINLENVEWMKTADPDAKLTRDTPLPGEMVKLQPRILVYWRIAPIFLGRKGFSVEITQV